MKKSKTFLCVILSINIIILTIFISVLFFRYNYLSLFTINKTVIQISLSNNRSYSVFYDWLTKNNLSAMKPIVVADDRLNLYVANISSMDEVVLKKGRMPGDGEFLCDYNTGDEKQSGLIRHFFPGYAFKVYDLGENIFFNQSETLIINTIDSDLLNELNSIMEEQGTDIEIDNSSTNNLMIILLSSFSLYQIILSTIILLLSICYAIIVEKNLLKRIDENGLSNYINKTAVIKEILWKMIGSSFCLCSVFCLLETNYREYIVIILIAVTISSLTYLFIIVSTYLVSCRYKKRQINTVWIYVGNYVVKCLLLIITIISFCYSTTIWNLFADEIRNHSNWNKYNSIYCLAIADVGQISNMKIEAGLLSKIKSLYDVLAVDCNAFIMDANDINYIDLAKEDIPLTGLLTNGFHTHITVSPNYFIYNPIKTTDGKDVLSKLVVSEDTLNILVPESKACFSEQLKKEFLEYFEFNRYGVYDSIYSKYTNEGSKQRLEELKINIIYVADHQDYFTFSPEIRIKENNRIKDPVVVVYTNNFHDSYIYSTATRCLYFSYDGNKNETDGYLASVIGKKEIVFAVPLEEVVKERRTKTYQAVLLGFGSILYIGLVYMQNELSYIYSMNNKRRYLYINAAISGVIVSCMVIITRITRIREIINIDSVWKAALFTLALEALFLVLKNNMIKATC